MRKPAFCIFLWPLCSDIIFFIDHYCAGGGGGYQISIAYCLFSLAATCSHDKSNKVICAWSKNSDQPGSLAIGLV